jgi:hypothetical protein
MRTFEQMKRERKSLGGFLKTVAPIALGAVNPALGMGASIGLSSIEALLQKEPPPPELPDVNPVTGMALGGNFIQWNAPSHAKGGQLVNRDGLPSLRGNIEIEKKENMYKSSKGGYVYSDRLKNPMTGNTVAKDVAMANKKYGKKEDDLSKNAHAFLMEKYRKLNEKLRMKQEMGNGGSVKKYSPGGFFDGNPPLANQPAYQPGVPYPTGLPYQAMHPAGQPMQSLAAQPTNIASFGQPNININTTSAKRGTGLKLSGFDAGNALKGIALGAQAIDALVPSEKERLRLPDYTPGDRAMKGIGTSPQAAINEITRGEEAAAQTARSSARNFNEMAQRLSSIYGSGAARKALQTEQSRAMNNQLMMQVASREDQKTLGNRAELIRQQEAQSMNNANRRLAIRHFTSNLTQLGTSLQKLQYVREAMKNQNELAKMKARDFLKAMNLINPNIQVDLDKALSDLSNAEWSELFTVTE